MECPKCGFKQDDRAFECFRCGLIFSKYRKIPDAAGEFASADVQANDDKKIEIRPVSAGLVLKDLFFDTDPEINTFVFWGRVLFFLAMIIWGAVLMSASIKSNYVGGSFWHLVNLPFHEAGHIIFRPFGRIIHSLGGSLGQLLMPLVCFFVFLIRTRDRFAASFCVWWLGENFLDMAPYINDARSLSLPLLGGNTGYSSPYGFHDWEFILTELGIARHDHLLALISKSIGIFFILLSFAWCSYLLSRQYRYLR